MRALRPVIGLVAALLAASAAVAAGSGTTASAACPPTQTSQISVQIGDATPPPTPAPSPTATTACEPGPNIPAATGSTGNTGGAGNTGGKGSTTPRHSQAWPVAATPQTAPAGAPGAPVPPGQPTESADTLEVTPDRVNAGDSVTVAASGFTAGEQVQIVLYSTPVIIGSYPAGAGGELIASFVVPIDTRTGTHTIEATGWDSDHVANGTFVVVSAPDAAGVATPAWWLTGLLIALGLGALVMLVAYRASIARLFQAPRTTEATP